MGTFTKADVQIVFKDGVPSSFKSAVTLKGDLMAFFLKTNPNHKGRVDIFIHDCEINDEMVDIEVSSERYQNCEFQVDLIRDFLVANYPTEVTFFSVSGYTAADDLGSTFSDENEWNDYVNEE